MVDKRHEARNTKLEKALREAQQVPCNPSECKQKSAIESLQQELAEAQAALASQAECVPEGYKASILIGNKCVRIVFEETGQAAAYQAILEAVKVKP